MDVRSQLVADARIIAVHRGYTDLVDGLQPLDRLTAKLTHEQEELADALQHKTHLHALHEAADVLYYAACIYDAAKALIAANSISVEQAEAAALVKYNWRASGKNNKNEAYELSLIEAAIK